MTEHEVLQIYISLTPFLAEVCGSGAEIAVHDMTDPEHSLVAIKNSISGRQVGSPLTDLAREVAEKGAYSDTDYLTNYSGQTKNGEFLSSTYFIKNKGRLIGLLCVNKDIESIQQMKYTLDHVMEQFNLIIPHKSVVSETLDNPDENIMHSRIAEAVNQSGVQPARMSMDEKIDVVRQLNESGIMTIKGAVAEVARQLSISVPTVYRYINKTRFDKKRRTASNCPAFSFHLQPQLRGRELRNTLQPLHGRCAAHTKSYCAVASVVEDEEGTVLVLQIVKAPAPRAAFAVAGLRDERLFSHRVDEPVARERPLRRKAELKAAFRRVKNVFARRTVDKLRGRENDGAAACLQARLLRGAVGSHRVAGAERKALFRGKSPCLRGKVSTGLPQLPRTDEADTAAFQKRDIALAE